MELYDLQKVCRICLKSDILVSIFSQTTFLLRPIEIIEKLNIFKLQPEDNLPTLLCESCLYRLLDAYNLQQSALASEQQLRDYLQQKTSSLELSEREPDECCSSLVVGSTSSRDIDDVNPSSSIYANICEMFERQVQPTMPPAKPIEITNGDEVLNDVEIDVSSLTRSEADDTLNEVFVSSSSYDFEKESSKQTTDNSKRRTKVSHKCNECDKTFKSPSYLETHKRTHTGEKPFQCKICARRFAQSSKLQLHQRVVHVPENSEQRRRFQCEICAAFFTTSSNLKAHRATHTERRDFQCGHCKRTFKTLRELRRHEPVHKPAKDIVCELCSKAFHKRSYLNAHRATVHQRIRRYKCCECTKVFASKSNLSCHLRTHSGEKPFACRFCAWKFNQSSALNRHMKKHLKEPTKQNDFNEFDAATAAADAINVDADVDNDESALDCSMLSVLMSST